jgi:hypothetical protein
LKDAQARSNEQVGHPDAPPVIRIAMWSGPRNISTAMMRSFEARGDCAVSDEPFYAAYLAAHRHRSSDARGSDRLAIARAARSRAMLTGPIPAASPFGIRST